MNLQTKYKIQIAKIASGIVRNARRVLGKPDQACFVRGDFHWELNLSEGIDFSIFLLGAFEPDLRRFYAARIKAGDVVLDIGANIGAHTLPLAGLVGEKGRVLAFEATVYAAQKLRRNLELNPSLLPQVSIFHAFLVSPNTTARPDEITSSWPLAGTSNSKLDGGATKTVGEALTMTLDEAVLEAKLECVDWIKIDVDGNESTVLKGAEGVLRKFHPRILIEFSPYCHAEGSFAELLAILTRENYRFYTVPSLQALPQDEATLGKHIPARGSINVLAQAEVINSG